MNEEEKQAIESLRKNRGVSFAQADIILNLIEQQQEEIEERDIILQEEINENCRLKTELYGNSISKYTIRAKIKRCKNELEENNKNIDYTRKLIYTADETIKKEIQDLQELLEE